VKLNAKGSCGHDTSIKDASCLVCCAPEAPPDMLHALPEVLETLTPDWVLSPVAGA
jgi:hypothetical protein